MTKVTISSMLSNQGTRITLPALERFVAERATGVHRIVPLDRSGRLYIPELLKHLGWSADTKLAVGESSIERMVIVQAAAGTPMVDKRDRVRLPKGPRRLIAEAEAHVLVSAVDGQLVIQPLSALDSLVGGAA